MPKHERKQLLNKLQAANQKFPNGMPAVPFGFPPYMYPSMYPRPMPNRGHKTNYRKPQNAPQKPPIISNEAPQTKNNIQAGNKEDEPSLDYLNSLSSPDAQKDYLGEYLFKKIEQHPIAQRHSLGVETISKITGMILGIEDIKEIYNITINNDSIGARIEEALSLLEGNY